MSLDYQSDNAAGYARRAGLEVVHYFTVIESASKGGRKIFNYMLDLALGFGVKKRYIQEHRPYEPKLS